MTAERQVVVICDGPDIGTVDLCARRRTLHMPNLYAARAALKREGWTRRHHEDRLIDLCVHCSGRVEVEPNNSGGRPRKQ